MLKEIERLKRSIKRAQAKISIIQNDCPHPKETLKITPRGDTGNYDQTEDCYWNEYYCGDCDKKWTGDYKPVWR